MKVCKVEAHTILSLSELRLPLGYEPTTENVTAVLGLLGSFCRRLA